MSHDRLCQLADSTCSAGGKHQVLADEIDGDDWCDRCDLACLCRFLAKARADEREKAAQRVAALMDSDPVKGETWAEFLDALAAAVRGES